MREALKKFPDCNIIAEPSKRDTAAAVALGVAWVAARDPPPQWLFCRPIT